MMSRKAFTLVEVLIATLILSVSILSMSAAFKQFFSYREKFNKYQTLYITTLSLVDKISTESLEKRPAGEGKINGLNYRYEASLVLRNRNFVYGESEQISGNKGNFEIQLYRVTLYVENKVFNFYVTRYKKLALSSWKQP